MFNIIDIQLIETIILPKLIAVVLLIIISFILRTLLIICGQLWVRTISQTATIVLLPIITFVVTSVISGNIALSLGMVGALSIVRFRNPVRSPFELTSYFFSITSGVAAAVSLNWLIFLTASTILAVLTIYAYNSIYRIVKKKDAFQVSFSEGNEKSILEISSKESVSIKGYEHLLVNENKTGNTYQYTFMSSDFASLQSLINKIKMNPSIETYNIRR